jgi:hypothetical protein
MVDLPDFGTPLRRIAGSVEKIAGEAPGGEAAAIAAKGPAHADATHGPVTAKADAARSEVQSHA